MKSASWMSAVVMIVILGTARAAAPSDDEIRWSKSIATFVDVLAGRADTDLLPTISTTSAWIAPFDMNRTESISVLPARLPSPNIVSARAYLHPSVSSASDIVGDLVAAGTIDPEIMKRLTPEDPADLRKADATMARWFATALEVKAGEPVAVLVLYDDAKTEPVRKPTLSFVLIRGEIDPAGNARVSRVLYGPMESAVK